MGAEVLIPLAVVGGLILVVVLAVVWIRAETRRSAAAEAQARVDTDALEAERRGETDETQFRAVDRDARLKQLLDDFHARHPEGLPRDK